MIAAWVAKPCSDRDIVDAVKAVVDEATVLIVEDDLDLARVIVASLEAHGVRTKHAATGREAIEACRATTPRAIVLDLVLPELDGFAVVDWFRENRSLAGTPLLVYSAQEISAADEERLRLGPTEFLTKSRVSLAQFEERVLICSRQSLRQRR